MGSRKWYDYSFFYTLPAPEKEKTFEKLAVHESHKVSRQLVLNSFSNIPKAISFDSSGKAFSIAFQSHKSGLYLYLFVCIK